MLLALTIVALLIFGLVALRLWRASDRQADSGARREVRATAGVLAEGFDPASVDDLPDPARRYFRFAISPGAQLRTVAEIDSLGA